MTDLQETARAGLGQPRPSAGSSPLRDRAGPAFRLALGIFVFFLVLEFVTSLGLVPSIYLPKASTVIQRMAELLVDPKFLKHVVATLAAWAAGLAVATII